MCDGKNDETTLDESWVFFFCTLPVAGIHLFDLYVPAGFKVRFHLQKRKIPFSRQRFLHSNIPAEPADERANDDA